MVNIAILGFGVVGSGVADVICKNKKHIERKIDNEISVKYILDIRSFPDSEYADRFVDNFEVIINDPEVQVVVETIGGATVAYDYTKRALQAGKNVVTSNKELVAQHGHELLQIAKETNTNYLFEASVGGGIPVIRPITQCLSANRITEVYGILNGTTNYILTRMISAKMPFEMALKEAQEKGYAEADPSADILGQDSCRKICILSALSFGKHVYPKYVSTEGIENVTEADAGFAKKAGMKIKLLGRSIRFSNGQISAYVAPHMIPADNMLANIEGVFNGITIRGDAVGDVVFYGPGAGKMPTASAVVADIMDAAKHFHARKFVDWDDGYDELMVDSKLIPSKWYIRGEFSEAEAKAVFPDIQWLGEDEKTGGKAAIVAWTSQDVLEELGKELDIRNKMRIIE